MSDIITVEITVENWIPTSFKTLSVKANKSMGKSVGILSTQTSGLLLLSTPRMFTWGPSIYTNPETGEAGKPSMSICFPNEDNKTNETSMFLNKLKEFEECILNNAFEHRELWWAGDQKIPGSKESVNDRLNPILKYQRNKETKRLDYTLPPSLSLSVPCYEGKWKTRIFNTDKEKIFPLESIPDATPMDFIPKGSLVQCLIKCGGIYLSGKGWGVKWELVQCMVKPREQFNLNTEHCLIAISEADRASIKKQKLLDAEQEDKIEINEETGSWIPPTPTIVVQPPPAPIQETAPIRETAPIQETVPIQPPPEEPVSAVQAPESVDVPKIKKVIKKKSNV